MKLYLIILLSMLVSCKSSHQAKTYEHGQPRYEFSYPSNWTIRDWGESSVEVIGPSDQHQESGPEHLTINVGETEGKDIDECFETYVNRWYREQDRGLAKESGSTDLNGRTAKWTEYQYVQGGVSMTNLVYLVFCGDTFALLSATCSTERYPGLKSQFLLIVNSFTIATPGGNNSRR